MKLVKDLGLQYPTVNSKRKARFGIYECQSCYSSFRTQVHTMKRKPNTKCIDCSKLTTNVTHGMSKHKLYRTWVLEKSRCNNRNDKSYCDYGGRGILFSSEFHEFDKWLDYVESLHNVYKDGYTIDRIDNNGNYEKGNLRWASKNTQSRNTRVLSAANTSGYRGVSSVGNKWKVQISIDNKNIYLGTFDTQLEAAKAYDKYVLDNKLEHTINKICYE